MRCANCSAATLTLTIPDESSCDDGLGHACHVPVGTYTLSLTSDCEWTGDCGGFAATLSLFYTSASDQWFWELNFAGCFVTWQLFGTSGGPIPALPASLTGPNACATITVSGTTPTEKTCGSGGSQPKFRFSVGDCKCCPVNVDCTCDFCSAGTPNEITVTVSGSSGCAFADGDSFDGEYTLIRQCTLDASTICPASHFHALKICNWAATFHVNGSTLSIEVRATHWKDQVTGVEFDQLDCVVSAPDGTGVTCLAGEYQGWWNYYSTLTPIGEDTNVCIGMVGSPQVSNDCASWNGVTLGRAAQCGFPNGSAACNSAPPLVALCDASPNCCLVNYCCSAACGHAGTLTISAVP